VIKILLVEDEPDMLDLTAYVLRRERFVVAEAADGAAALRRWKADRPDIVILDLGLPSVDGFEVLRKIREESETPVLILTGRPKGPDLARAFNLGTDDFLAKPFEYRELIARIRAILRRAKTAQQEVREPKVEANGLVLDPEAYEVTWREQICRLTPTEFRILYLLVTNAGHVVSANRLYTYVWGADGGDANALRSHISHLRHKLEIGDQTPGTITSVPAVGYVFRPIPIEQVDSRPASPPVATVRPIATSSAFDTTVASPLAQASLG
jgi:DNA-binding response OmpR family regulator